MTSLWRILEDLSKMSAGKSLVELESMALLRSMKDSKEMESTFTSITSCLLRTKLAHRVETVFATRSWHLAPARMRRASLDNWRAWDFMVNVHQSIHKVASITSDEDKIMSVLLRLSNECNSASNNTRGGSLHQDKRPSPQRDDKEQREVTRDCSDDNRVDLEWAEAEHVEDGGQEPDG